MTRTSELEEMLAFQIKAAGLPIPEREYRFHPTRRWPFDFAYPERKIAIEVQGGTWSGGAHGRGSGIERDYEKINAAQILGWTVLQFSTTMIKSGEALEAIEKILNQKE